MEDKSPKIRFQKYQDSWKPKTLNELGLWSKGQPLSKSDITDDGEYPCIHYGELFSYNEIINKVISTTNSEPIVTSKGNELLFPDSDVTPDGLGRCSSITIPNVILGGGINILQLHNDYSAPYCALNVVKNKKQIIDRVTGSTVRHIHSRDLSEVEINVSTSYIEQQKIGEFFEQLDELICAKEQEVEKLKQIKAALLDKMFPSVDEDKPNRGGYNALICKVIQNSPDLMFTEPAPNTPQIRFRGFTEPWKKGTLGDYGYVSMCKRIMKYQTSEKGDVPFYKIGTFGDVPDAYISYAIYNEYSQKYPFPQKGDILISAAGTIGRVVEYTGKKEYFQDSNIVWLNHNDQLDNSFLKVFYLIAKWNGLEGSTLKRLYNANLLSTTIYAPSITEQRLIGDFFREQDEAIRNAQQQIIKLRNIKQSCLQKMFA